MIVQPQNKLNILLVEDQPICRMGIRMTLDKSEIEHQVLAEAATVAEALGQLASCGPQIDLIILDYVLPDGTGMDVISAVKKRGLAAKIVILSGEAGGAVLKQLMEAGVNGFMSKSVGPDEITSVLRSVMAGNDCTNEAHLRIKSDLKDDYETMKSLSHREIELISLCASGLNTKQIAEEMCVTPHSIENMKSSLFGKIGVKSTNELILYAFRVGLVG